MPESDQAKSRWVLKGTIDRSVGGVWWDHKAQGSELGLGATRLWLPLQGKSPERVVVWSRVLRGDTTSLRGPCRGRPLPPPFSPPALSHRPPPGAQGTGDREGGGGSGDRWKTGNGNPLQYSCLENPMCRGAWWALVRGSQRVGQD